MRVQEKHARAETKKNMSLILKTITIMSDFIVIILQKLYKAHLF